MIRKPLIVSFELGLCVALMAFIAVAAVRSFQPGSATLAMTAARHFNPPTMQDVEVALYRVGITPQTLTASGGSTADVDTVIDRMQTALTDEPGLLVVADEALADAQRDADRLTRLVRSGQATEQQQTECQQAIQTLAQEKIDHAAMMDALFADVVQPLNQDVKTALLVFKANERWRTPTEFRIVERGVSDWVRLRDALANERISAKYDEEPDQDDQTFLTNERSNTSIALATTRLDTNLASITSRWNQLINEE